MQPLARRAGVSTVVGLDIGGANLKAVALTASSPAPAAISVPFALWKQPDALAQNLAALLQRLPAADALAVTMTGELCDCFATKEEGVRAIIDAVQQIVPSTLPTYTWAMSGRFYRPDEAVRHVLQVAAANWHALATATARQFAPRGPALLLDIGSTTTDIIPLDDGRPCPTGWTDTERLQSGELVYRGVRRTPICALHPEGTCAEWFATTLDVFLLLGDITENAADCETADGRPATRHYACARLARMLGGDSTTIAADALLRFAGTVAARLQQELERAIRRVLDARDGGRRPWTVILSGSGEFLAQRLVAAVFADSMPRPVGRSADSIPQVVRLSQVLGPEVSACAPAWAVAVLARQQLGG